MPFTSRTLAFTALCFFALPYNKVFADVLPKGCLTSQALYSPNSDYKNSKLALIQQKKLTFTLRPVASGREESVAAYLEIYAFDGEKKVSQIRLGQTCSNGANVCGLDSEQGQYNDLKNFKSLKENLAFEFVAIDKNLMSTPLRLDAPAPQAIYLLNTANAFRYFHPENEDVNYYTKYFSDKKIFPEFSGYDSWVLTDCIN